MAYITLPELRDYIQDPGQLNEVSLQAAIDAAQIEVDTVCGRTFSADTTATARKFWPYGPWNACVDDFYTTTGLIVAVDINGDGTYSQTWTLDTDFYVEPINQRVGGITGHPYNELTATRTTYYFPDRQNYLYTRPTIKVTAKWGWSAVPNPVKQATLIIAQKLYKLGNAPFGVAGMDQFGVVRVGNIPEVQNLLGPYMLDRYAVA